MAIDRRLVIGLGGVVAVGAIVLVMLLRDRTDPSDRIDRPDRSDPAVEGSHPIDRTRTADPAPQLAGDGAAPIEAARDGARVRDHRSGDRVPYTPRSRIGEARTSPRLPPALVHAISAQLEGAMVECTEALPADPQGRRPKVSGSVFVDVAQDQLTVTEVVLGELGAPAVRSCIENRWMGQSISAAGAAETSHYEITVVFAVAPRSRGD